MSVARMDKAGFVQISIGMLNSNATVAKKSIVHKTFEIQNYELKIVVALYELRSLNFGNYTVALMIHSVNQC